MAAGEHAAGEVMASVSMYCTAVCPYCQMAERLLRAKGVAVIEKIRVDVDPARRTEMMQRTGRRTVPQIYIGELWRSRPLPKCGSPLPTSSS